MAADDWVDYAVSLLKSVHSDQTLCTAAASLVCVELQAFLLTFCDSMNASDITLEHIKANTRSALATGAGDLAKYACAEIAKSCAGEPYELTFGVNSVRSVLMKARPQLASLDREAATGLTTLIDYLAAEIIQLAGNSAREEHATNATAKTRIAYCPADDLGSFDEGISKVVVRQWHVRKAVAGDEELLEIFPRLGRRDESSRDDATRAGSRPTADEMQSMDIDSSWTGASAGASSPGSGASSSGTASSVSRTASEGARVDAAEGASADVRVLFKRAASFVQPHGSFAVDGVVDFVQPLLKVDEMDEPLAFPLLAAQAEELKKHAKLTPLGHFVPSSKLGFGSRGWAPAVEAIVPQVLKGMGVDRAGVRVTAKLRGILLCSASGRSNASAAPGVFGSLEVSLPSVRGGGGLKLWYGDETVELAPRDAAEAAVRCHYAAFYSACARETLPLLVGYRLVLQYDLVATGPGAQDRLEPPRQAGAVAHFAQLAQAWAGQSTGPSKLCYFLEHSTASWDKLQGRDAAVTEALAAAESDTGKAFDLQLVHFQAREEDGYFSFSNTWKPGPVPLPPAIAQEVSRGRVELNSNHYVQGEKYWSEQNPDEEVDSDEDNEDNEDRYEYEYDEYSRGRTPSARLYDRDAIVLWPRDARLQVVSSACGLGFATRALASAFQYEAEGKPPPEDTLLGFASSLELLAAMMRLQSKRGARCNSSPQSFSEGYLRHCKQALLMFQLVTAPDVPLAHFAAFMASGLVCDLSGEAEAKFVAKQLRPAIERHGCAATREPLLSCLSLALTEGVMEARHAGAWQVLVAVLAGADRSVAAAQPGEAQEVCGGLAVALVPSLSRSVSASPAAKLATASETAAAALLVAHLLKDDGLMAAVSSAIVVNRERFKPIYVLHAMAKMRDRLRTPPTLPGLAQVVVSHFVRDGGCVPPSEPCADLSLFVGAGLADQCVPTLVMRQQPESPPFSGFLRVLTKLLETPRRKEAVASSPALGQLLLDVTRRSGPPLATHIAGQPHPLVNLYMAAMKFDAGGASGHHGHHRDELAAILTSFPAFAEVLPSLPVLHAALDASSRQHPSFLKLLQAGEEALEARQVAVPQLKDWGLSVDLRCNCRHCAEVQNFLRLRCGPSRTFFSGEAYIFKGHTTVLAQAAASRAGSGFTCEVLSSKATKKYGHLTIQKVPAGQASDAQLARQAEARSKADAVSKLLEQLQNFRLAIDEALRSKQPPVDVNKYERMLRQLGSDPSAAGVRLEAYKERGQQQLPTPKEAASIAAISAGTATEALEPPSVRGAGEDLLAWTASHFCLEGERLSEWVAGHFEPACWPAIESAIDEAGVGDLAVLASLSRAELSQSLLGDTGAPDPVAQPGAYLGLRELELELRRLSRAADAGGRQPGVVAVNQIDAPPAGLWAPACTAKRPFTVVVAGDTGTGKSTLLNALLGYEILPTSCCRACTAAVIDASWGAWGASVQFIGEDEWSASCTAACAAQARAGVGKAPAADDPDIVEYERVIAVYGTSGPPLHQPDVLMRHPMVAQRIGREVSLVPRGADMSDSLAALVKPYVDSPDDADRGALWPLVKQVSLRGPFGVTVGGVRLCDVPGLHDNNAARNGVMRSILEEADALLIVSAITRAVNDKGAKALMPPSLRGQLLKGGVLGQLAFVASKSDHLTPSEVQENLQLPPGTGLAACVAARNAFTRASITQDFYDGQPTCLFPANLPPPPAETPWEETLRFELPVFTVSARDSLKLEGVVTGDAPPVLATPAETQVPAVRAYIGLAAVAHHARVARGLPDGWTRVGAMLLGALEDKEKQAATQLKGGEQGAGSSAGATVSAPRGAPAVNVAPHGRGSAVGKRPAHSELTRSKENVPAHDGIKKCPPSSDSSSAACLGQHFSDVTLVAKMAELKDMMRQHRAIDIETHTPSVHGTAIVSGPSAKKARTTPPEPNPLARVVIDLCDSD